MIVTVFASLLAAALQTATPAAPPAVAAAPVDKPVCRREVPTGSNFAKKVCHSRAEWAAIDGANARGVASALDARRSNSPRN